MYNESVKLRFMKECLKTEASFRRYQRIFASCEKMEEKYGSDIYEMSKEEIEAALNATTGVRLGDVEEDYKIGYLRDYVRWCLENNIPNANDNIMTATIDVVEKARKKWIASPLQLKKYLDELFESEEEKTTAVVYRAYVWLAYLGVRKEDTCKIKTTDVDLNNWCIIYNDRKLDVYNEAWNTVKYAAVLADFNYVHPLYSKVSVRHRVESDKLLRGIKADPKGNTLEMKILHTYAAVHPDSDTRQDYPLSYENVWLSGWFYRMYELERAGMLGDNPFGELVDEQIKGVKYRYKGEILDKPNTTIRNARIKAQKSNYERWKAAFGR